MSHEAGISLFYSPRCVEIREKNLSFPPAGSAGQDAFLGHQSDPNSSSTAASARTTCPWMRRFPASRPGRLSHQVWLFGRRKGDLLRENAPPEWKAVSFLLPSHESHFLADPKSCTRCLRCVAGGGPVLPNLETAVNFMMDGRPARRAGGCVRRGSWAC